MNRKHVWLIALLWAALLATACGPEMATPTPARQVVSSPSPASVEKTPAAAQGTTPTARPISSTNLPVNPDDWRVLGSPEAAVTLIEYSDFQCPFCGRYARETFPQILQAYVLTGKIRYTFRNFPLSSIHPQAEKAAEAAECAGEQGKYWEMHEALFSNQQQWSGQTGAVQTFKQFAAGMGLDQARFDTCLDGGTYAEKIKADIQEGAAAGVNGTPAFRINGVELSGAQPYSEFARMIDYFLAGGQPPQLEIAADSYRSMGRADAPVTVTEFSDFQCPSCGAVAREVVPELIKRYVDTGKVRFVFREFPLTSLHPAAQKAAEAAICAGRQGKYWDMNEKLFASTAEWGAQGVNPPDFFKKYAQEMGLDGKAFDECLDSGQASLEVQGELMAGQMAGVQATPTFFINDLPIQGGREIESLGQIIDYLAAGGVVPNIIPTADDWHLRGNRQTARAVTVAFVDYASSESAQHARQVLPRLLETYINPGQLLYVLYPWTGKGDSIGAQAAAAAECAGQQGRFWEMHDQIFSQQDRWVQAAEPRPLFLSYAQTLGLDTAKFETCLDSDWVKLRVQAGNVVAALYNVPGAPVFLFNNGQGRQGSPSFDEFKTIIDSIINQ